MDEMDAPLIDLSGIDADEVRRLGDSPLGLALSSALDTGAPGRRDRPDWESFI